MPTLNRNSKRPPAPHGRDKDPIALARKLVPDGELTDEDQRVIAELRDQGEPAIDELLACALTPRSGGLTGLAYVDANATRAKAIYALGHLQAERAVEPLLRALETTKPHTAERGFLGSCCIQLGALALEPALRLCKTSPLGPSDALLMLLSHLGVRDARVLELLISLLPINPAGAASLLGIYGDPAALPELRIRRDHALLLPDGPQSHDAKYLGEAIQKLGGVPAVLAHAPAGTAPPVATPKRNPASAKAQSGTQGRNERCACGSGKKYKVCCYLRA